jgi:hypothetical protein
MRRGFSCTVESTISCLLEIARYKVVKAAKAAGIALKQTFAAEGK